MPTTEINTVGAVGKSQDELAYILYELSMQL